MNRRFWSIRRVLLAPALLSCLVLASSVPAAAMVPPVYTPPPDATTGQIGHYDVRDYAYGSHDGSVDCVYHFTSGEMRIKQFVVRKPRIWWPDTSSSSSRQHGTVGWKVRIQQSAHPATDPWVTVYTSSVQKHTAYEDHPGYDDHDRARFSTRTIGWTSGQDVSFRIKTTVYWYRSDGSIKGQLDHWYQTYDPTAGPTPVSGFCVNRIPTS